MGFGTDSAFDANLHRWTVGTWIAAVFFGIVCTAIVMGTMWLVYIAPVKVEIYEREGQMYECSYWRDGEISCVNMNDSDVGGGREVP